MAGYSRGVETQKSGYQTKKINNAIQSVSLDDDGTDCRTKHYLNITLDKKTKKLFLYRYVLDPGSPEADKTNGLVLLTPENIDKYVGKPLKMRSPMYCKNKQICSKCAGEMFYKMGVKNAGLYTFSMSGKFQKRLLIQ